MNNKTQSIVRWIAILPCSVIAGIISVFLIHIVLFSTLNSFISPYPELPERVLTPFAFTLAFIWTGYQIAPYYKFNVSLILFTISILISGGVIISSLTGGKLFGKSINLDLSGLPAIMGVIGALTAILKIKKQELYQNISEESVQNQLNDPTLQNKAKTKSKSFYEIYGLDLFNSVLLIVLLLCLYNSTLRTITIYLFIILYLVETTTFLNKSKLLNKKIREKLILNILMIALLISAQLYSKYSIYVIIVCLLLQTYNLLNDFVKSHITNKNN